MFDKTIWTIGHSTHSISFFMETLKSFTIEMVADIRRYPGSKRFPHFNKDALSISLTQNQINYQHYPELGGRRNPKPDSQNTGWRLAAFKGYADYMETENFIQSIVALEQVATNQRVAYMCSEAVWWSCHRSLVSDFLKHRQWTVMHIMNVNKSNEHPYTSPARISNGILHYKADTMF